MADYTNSASLYDALYHWKDYAAEAHKLRKLIEARAQRPVKTLLDVACGTGAHLVHLVPHYACTGLDLSAQLLDVARLKLPQVPFVQADMRDFELGRTFDAVVCLFSAVGYVETVDGLRQAVASMARCVAPGGVLVVEPWFGPLGFEAGHMSVLTADDAGRKIVRANVSRVDGKLSILDFHYLVLTPEGVHHFTEQHTLGLFSNDENTAAFVDAGLDVVREPHGLDGRGLYIGLKPD